MFSKEGPNLMSPELTNNPNVIPNMYKLKNNISSGKPNFKIETPNNGEVNIIAGTNPIKVLIKAVKINDTTISFNLRNELIKTLPSTEIIFPDLSYCTDNAAMIAYLGEIKLKIGMNYNLDFSIKPNMKLS